VIESKVLQREAQAMAGQLVAWRRDFHRHPELGFMEVRTGGIVADYLASLGYRVQRHVGKTGVVGLLAGARPGPTVMLRFDIDALPIQEENETDYASQNPGVMHACGHDAHTAIGLGVATLLARHRQDLAGQIKLVFQPNEEGHGGSNGAPAMIADGVLENPAPEVAFGLHMWNSLEVGYAVVQPGAMMASTGVFTIRVHGLGGHGAIPQQSIDPIVVASQMVLALQTVVSRNVPPMQPAVLTVGKIEAGSAFNIIPPTAEMVGTVRTFANEVQALVARRMEAIVTHVAEAFGATATLQFDQITPPLVNAEAPTAFVRQIAEEILGEGGVVPGEPSMGGEDMSFYLEKVPGCFFFLGSRNEAKGLVYGHHHPRFDIDEGALPLGAAILATAALRYGVQNAVEQKKAA